MMQSQQQPTQTQQLADIHIPPKPSAWPPAIGWWVILGLAVSLLALFISKVLRYQKLKKQQKLTLQLFETLETELQKSIEKGKGVKGVKVLSDINTLLRRIALMHYPREQIASLTGREWLAFLDHSGGTKDFSQGSGQLLADAPYLQSMPEVTDIKALSKVIRQWVKQVSIKKKGAK